MNGWKRKTAAALLLAALFATMLTGCKTEQTPAAPEPSLPLVTSVVKPPPSYSLRAAARGETAPVKAEPAPENKEPPVRTVSLSGDANRAAVLPVVTPDRERPPAEADSGGAALVPLTDEESGGARRPPRTPGASHRKPKNRGGKPAETDAK